MSPQQKRSQQYDWFKGPTAKGGPKDRKSQAKKVWKFTKIFIYLALFVFSMTGCIQSLIIKTTNYVGTGVEFYANRDEVAPHVSKLQLSHTPGVAAVKDSKGQVTTKAVEEVYSLSSPASNIWLNKEIKPASGSGLATLKDVQTAVLKQNDAGNLKLEDAFKGSNEALWISKLGDTSDFNGVSAITTKQGTTPLVLSSLATKSAFDDFGTGATGTGAALAKTKVKIWTLDATTKKYVATPLIISTFDTPEYQATVKKTLDGITGGSVTAGAVEQMVKDSLALVSSDTNKIKSVNAVLSKYHTNLARQNYADAVLTEVLNSGDAAFDTWLGETVTTADQADAKMSFVKNLMDTFQLTWNSKTDATKGFHYTAGKYPFFSGSTNWRPLVSWGDAWGEGPFYGLFVYPTAYISANMIASFPGGMAGWETLITIFVVVFSMRFLAFLLSFKATMQQTRMQELAAKKAIIDAKYAPYKGNKQMENRQRQEVSEMYKKQGVSPFGSMTSIFITMPLFLAIWRTIGALPHIKSTVWLGINFSATSWRELFHGSFQYLPLMILAAGFAAFQQILPRLLTKRRDRTRINVQQKAAMKKGNKTQNIMMLVFVFMSLIFSAGLQVYWIAGGVWMTIQSTLTHFLIIRQSKNRKRNRIKT